MKKLFATLTLLLIITTSSFSQKNIQNENYGKTLNIGVGVGGYAGYYGYVGHSVPVLHLDYEFSVEKNFTLAPFVGFCSYSNGYYWGNNNNPYKTYFYHETNMPVGLKGTYYFDQLLNANAKWDFYLAGSIGFVFVKSSWDSDYKGDQNYYRNQNQTYFDFHVGTEYHLSNKVGLLLDLSTGVSTIGLAIH